MKVLDFRTLAGVRVELTEFGEAPLVSLRVGGKRNRAILNVSEAREVRDALDDFIEEFE